MSRRSPQQQGSAHLGHGQLNDVCDSEQKKGRGGSRSPTNFKRARVLFDEKENTPEGSPPTPVVISTLDLSSEDEENDDMIRNDRDYLVSRRLRKRRAPPDTQVPDDDEDEEEDDEAISDRESSDDDSDNEMTLRRAGLLVKPISMGSGVRRPISKLSIMSPIARKDKPLPISERLKAERKKSLSFELDDGSDSPLRDDDDADNDDAQLAPPSPALGEEELDKEAGYKSLVESSEVDEKKILEGAAFKSRLPADKLSTLEAISLSDIAEAPIQTQKLYLYYRNTVLRRWLENPRVELTFRNFWDQLEPPFDSDLLLAGRTYLFLERHGFINFGVFESLTPPVKATGKSVIVIGAGISGLIASRQLKRFGIDVTILESRDRVGGRIVTFRKQNYLADLGAMVVTGLGGNPISVLSKQIKMKMHKIKQKCPLFEADGDTVPQEKDEKIEKEFNRLLETSSYISHHLDFNYVNGKAVSLGEALEWVIKLQEKAVKEQQMKYYETQESLLDKQKHLISTVLTKQKELANLRAIYDDMSKTDSEKRSATDQFKFKATLLDLKECVKELENAETELLAVEGDLNKLQTETPPEVYLSPRDRQILDWHLANLEFANAAPLSNLSLKDWDQDDDFAFTGSHLTISNGYSSVPVALSKDLEIRFSTAVREINAAVSHGVEVITSDADGETDKTTYTADTVLCTLPLGVLKHSLNYFNGQNGPPGLVPFKQTCANNVVQFIPSLPKWKTDAVNRLGFGNLNKVVLCFDEIFWDTTSNLFGHVGSTTTSRGELFLFWSLYGLPVLLALIAGDAAAVMEEVSDDVVVGRCMAVLKAIFGEEVPQPREFVVTRWKNDPWSRGSYSFVSVGANGNDYDLMAAPVSPSPTSRATRDSQRIMEPMDALKPKDKPHKVYFAGEHTIRNYPATVHGALLSGLREAGRIADEVIGRPYDPENANKIIVPLLRQNETENSDGFSHVSR